MMRWVLLACLAAMAGATSPPVTTLPDISKYAIFLTESKAQETTTFTLKQTVITITKHSAAESSALAAKKRVPKIIVTDAAAKGLVCVAAGQVEVTSAGEVIETGGSTISAEGGSATSVGVEEGAAVVGGHVEGGTEGGKSEELLVGQGDGVVASVSSAAAAGGGAAASAASGGGAAASSAAVGGGAASSAAGGGAASSAAAGHGSAASSAAGEGSAASSAAGEGSAASSAAGEGSAASSAAGEGSAASSAAGEGSAASSAAGEGSAASSAAGEGSAASSGAGDSSSSSSISSGGKVDVDVTGSGEAAAYSGGESVHISGSGKITHVDESSCICVPDILCGEDGFINTSGEGIINIRSFTRTKKTRAYASKCKDTEVCCTHRKNEQIGWSPGICGERSPIPLDRRVVGGEVSRLGKFPWMVAIILSLPGAPDKYVCGGSLIRENVVLTGAHCVDKLHDQHLIVRVGEWDTCNDDELYPHIDIDVASIVQHEDFNSATLYSDVALLTLSHAVERAPHINTICLPHGDIDIADIDFHDCVATGWGKESFTNTQYTNILKEVPLEVVDHDSCQEALRTTRLGNWFQLHDTFTCAGGKPNVDTCSGDGGSSLVCKVRSDYEDEQRFVQVGIVAWGIGCGKSGIPGVYADVQKLLPWIESHLPADEYAYP